MNFEETIIFLKQGRKMRRASWNNTESKINCIKIFQHDKSSIWASYPAQYLVEDKEGTRYSLAKFELQTEDILADDWEIYDPETDKGKEDKNINDNEIIKAKVVTEQVCYGWWNIGFNSNGLFDVWCCCCGKEANNNSITNYCPNCGTKMFGLKNAGDSKQQIIFNDLYKKTERTFTGFVEYERKE